LVLYGNHPSFIHLKGISHGQVFHCVAARCTHICIGDFLDVFLMPRHARNDGKTLPSRHGQPEPRLPHEHDESSDGHPGTKDKRIAQAATDLANGQEDTGRTPVVTELASRQFPPRPGKKPRL
jgi:hypothetical protein